MSKKSKQPTRRRGLWRKLRRLLASHWGRRVDCPSGRHKPRRGAALWEGGSWHADCRWCGARLRRVAKGTWVED